MSDAEMFLMAWAVIATCVAGFYANRNRYTNQAIQALMFAISEVAEGKAELTLVDDRVQIKKRKE